MFKRLLLCITIVILVSQSTPNIAYMPSLESLLSQTGKPSFIDYIDDDSHVTNDPPDICMYVKEYNIWEPIDEDSEVYQSIRNTTNVLIDSNTTPPVLVISDLNLIAHCINGDLGNCIGSHGGITGICFGVGGLALGQHIAYVDFKSTGGKRFSYLWVFEIKEDGIMPEVTATSAP
ncbi:MAG: hypothetical protein H0X30_19460 [Anaerolineae bacterium]|nr:hypothetical protein [Anaerolineae bacterium]